jgi:hypothetical protein
MKKFRMLTICILTIGVVLLPVHPVQAVPPLPSSFYGTAKLNGANVPDGTLVQASIGGKIITEMQTQTYKGESIYSLDIPGDDSDTLDVEGGKDGDTIIFILGGIEANQTGVWKSGTLVSLDLSATSAATLVPLQATLTPVVSQTAILLMTATPTQFTAEAQASPMNAVLTPASSVPTAGVPPTLTIPIVANPGDHPVVSSTTNLYTVIVIAGFILFIILFTTLLVILVRKPKVK